MLSRHGVVVREQRGLLVELAGVRRRDRVRHRRVDSTAAVLQLRGERHLLCQGVLEGVRRHREQRRLVEKLARLQRRQGGVQVAVREARASGGGEHLAQDRLGEFLADDGRGLQHALLAFGQAIDARGEQRLHRRRHVEPRDRPRQAVSARRAGEVPRLDQALHDLLDE
ncbi:MAG: hypothetical protein FJ148_17220 [Deltaproteobacteria bacterium]|nr:hypothetical protein [Deltaproteobacteria bacterium]